MKKIIVAFVLVPFLLFYAPHAGATEKEERSWEDETIYFLLVDRFNNGDINNDFEVDTQDPLAYHGGDFQGVIKKLDYLKSMGFTAIWLAPIFDNSAKGYHGYWITDFYNTEEHFGTIEEFKTLVAEAHKRDMKIILDFVVNHTSPEHPWVHDPEKQDWFHEPKEIINWSNQEQLENGWIYGLPDLAQENPEVKEYLINVAKWWITETDIDGYRLDTVKHVPVDFWEDFVNEVKSVKDDFYLLGEVLDSNPDYLNRYAKTGIDGFVDYPLFDRMRSAFASPDQSLSMIFSTLESNETIYERPHLMGQFIDNHDKPRFTFDIVKNKQQPKKRWELALTFMYTTPGIPIVYYGSEIALNGANDPDNRRLMEFRADPVLIEYIEQIGSIRNKYAPLRRGNLTVLYESGGMAIYKRTYNDETVVIALNNTTKQQDIKLEEKEIGINQELKGLLQNDLIREKDGQYHFVISPETSEIYLLKNKSGLNIAYIVVLSSIIILFPLLVYIMYRRGKRKIS
ncbi:alpha-amylase family glycosyl hydrolase [Bacillus kwashiorkori]|uniref:alpha-amylase family glycosyl hydrolase n=1 Tax=Bacillus kwashiorkori TaxID=1522318 RepID=UPI0007849D66|nr:alpha-amylase family glycosyl hydrolase [Bacillus kwashiorkori]